MHIHKSVMVLFKTRKSKVWFHEDLSGQPWGKKWGFQGNECFDLSSGVYHICQVRTCSGESNLTPVGLYFLSISLCSSLKMNGSELARDIARISIQLKSTC